MKLSKTQWNALEDFADAGGHGYGECAYLRRSTAKALARKGLVRLHRRDMGGGRSIPWGTATDAGRDLLKQRREARRRSFDRLIGGTA